MKTRNYFVSNSSSSSFICEICGRTETGFDASMRDFGYVCCKNDHTFCDEEILDGFQEYLDSHDDEDAEGYCDGCYDIPEQFCPICSFVEPSYPELQRYFLKTTTITVDEVFQEIKKVNKRRRVLRTPEYVEYVLKQQNLTIDMLMNNLREEFKEYKIFSDFLRSK